MKDHSYAACMAPKATSPEIWARLNAGLNEVAMGNDEAGQLREMGALPNAGGRAALHACAACAVGRYRPCSQNRSAMKLLASNPQHRHTATKGTGLNHRAADKCWERHLGE